MSSRTVCHLPGSSRRACQVLRETAAALTSDHDNRRVRICISLPARMLPAMAHRHWGHPGAGGLGARVASSLDTAGSSCGDSITAVEHNTGPTAHSPSALTALGWPKPSAAGPPGGLTHANLGLHPGNHLRIQSVSSATSPTTPSAFCGKITTPAWKEITKTWTKSPCLCQRPPGFLPATWRETMTRKVMAAWEQTAFPPPRPAPPERPARTPLMSLSKVCQPPMGRYEPHVPTPLQKRRY